MIHPRNSSCLSSPFNDRAAIASVVDQAVAEKARKEKERSYVDLATLIVLYGVIQTQELA